MHNHVPIAVGFIAVMLPTGTPPAWKYVVLIVLYSISSGEYCKEKSISVEAASTFTSMKLGLQVCCLGND